ncbi:LysR family transcriptional regulator [Amnibacterium kyonggiense]
MMLDLRRLRMLVALERLGTIAAVADELHVTASGISMQLAALEREIGVDLTERRGRRLALTPAGRLLADHGRELLDRLSVAELEVDALRRGAAGSYRIAAFPSSARTFVVDAWRTLLAGGTGLELSLSTPEPEDALTDLTSGRADLAVVHSYSNVPRSLPEDVEVTHLADEPVWIAVRADDPVTAARIDLADLDGHGWVVPTADRTCFQMVERACGIAGYRPRIVAESMDFAVLLELVAAGIGVALVPDLTVAALPAGVRLARPRADVLRHVQTATRSRARHDPGLRLLTSALHEAARDRIRADVV